MALKQVKLLKKSPCLVAVVGGACEHQKDSLTLAKVLGYTSLLHNKSTFMMIACHENVQLKMALKMFSDKN